MPTTIDEIRRENLLALIDRYKSIAEFNVALGRRRNDPTFALIKNRQLNRGKPRVMGDKIARGIEDRLGLSSGWMDEDHSNVPMKADYIDDVGLFRVKTIPLSGGPEVPDPINLDRSIFDKFFPGAPIDGFAAAAAQDDAMAPAINQGDRVLIDTRAKFYTKDGCYCIRASGRYLLRRLTIRLDGALIVSADGRPEEAASPIDAYPGLEIIGRVCYLWTGRVM